MLRKKNRHHLLPKSRGGANEGENIIRMDTEKHKALHKIFENAIITEQIWKLVQLNWNVLTNNFKARIWEVVNINPQEVYKPNAFLNSGKQKKLTNKFDEIT